MREKLKKNPARINWKQKSLVMVLLAMVAYAYYEYGTCGGILMIAISGVVLWIFFSGLSNKNNIPVPAGEYYQDGFEYDANYDPLFASLPQNIYHKD